MEKGSCSLKQIRWLVVPEAGDLAQKDFFSVGEG